MNSAALEDGFQTFSDAAKTLDQLHRDIGILAQKFSLSDVITELGNKLAQYFVTSELSVCIESDAADFLHALIYADYILRYLLFTCWRPTATRGLSEVDVDRIKGMVPLMASNSAILDEEMKLMSEEKMQSILAVLRAFMALKNSCEQDSELPVFARLLPDESRNQILVKFRSVVTIGYVGQFDADYTSLKFLCGIMDKIGQMGNQTELMIDLVLSAIMGFAQEFVPFFEIAQQRGVSEPLNLAKWCLSMSSFLVHNNVEMRTPYLHRFERFDSIRDKFNIEPDQLRDHLPSPSATFNYPPTSLLTVTDFWKHLLQTFHKKLPTWYHCPICRSTRHIRQAAVFDMCHHACCYACGWEWLKKQSVCPRCRMFVRNWTSLKLARPFLETYSAKAEYFFR